MKAFHSSGRQMLSDICASIESSCHYWFGVGGLLKGNNVRISPAVMPMTAMHSVDFLLIGLLTEPWHLDHSMVARLQRTSLP